MGEGLFGDVAGAAAITLMWRWCGDADVFWSVGGGEFCPDGVLTAVVDVTSFDVKGKKLPGQKDFERLCFEIVVDDKEGVWGLFLYELNIKMKW